MDNQPNQETHKVPAVPSKVQEINKIQQEKVEHLNALQAWEQDLKLRENSGLVPNSKPEAPESFSAAITLDQISHDEYLAGCEIMQEICNGNNPNGALLGYTLTDKNKQQIAEKLHLNQERMKILVSEVGNYSGSGPDSEMVRIVRSAAIINSVIKYNLTQVEELVAEVVRDNPEALHFNNEYTDRYVSNLYNGYSQIDESYGDKNKEIILKALAAETSPLSPQEREKAQFYLSETIGFRFFMGINTVNDASTINVNTLSDILGVKFTAEQWEKAKNTRNWFTVDQIPTTLATLSHNESLPLEDRKKLQAEVIGCIKAMEITSNQMVKTKSGGYSSSQELRPEALTRKKVAAETMLNLIDKENVRIFKILQNTDYDLLNYELRKIYNDQNLRFRTGDTESIFIQQNLEVLNKQNKIEQDRNTAQRLQKEKDDNEKAATDKEIKDAETKNALETYESGPIQAILQKVDYSQTPPTGEARKILAKDQGQLSKSKYNFVILVLNNLDDLRGRGESQVIFPVEKTIPGKKGFLGVGKTEDTWETYFVSNHGEINSKLAQIQNKYKVSENPSREDEALRLALEKAKQLPNKE